MKDPAVVQKLGDYLPGVRLPPRGEHDPKRAVALRQVFVVEERKGFASVPLADGLKLLADLPSALAVEVAPVGRAQPRPSPAIHSSGTSDQAVSSSS